MAQVNGPYVTLVAFCDEVRTYSDGTRDIVGQSVKKAIEKDGTLQIVGIVGVCCGNSPGRHHVKMTSTGDAGHLPIELLEQEMEFTEAGQEAAFFAPVGFADLEPGERLWLSVALNGREAARSPLLLLPAGPPSPRQVVSIMRPKSHDVVN